MHISNIKKMTILEKAQLWLSDTFDAETQAEIQNLIGSNEEQLTERVEDILRWIEVEE